MPRILLCWEGGRGDGHVVRLQRIVKALRFRGASCFVAAFDVRAAERLKEDGIPVLQAPTERWGGQKPPSLGHTMPSRDHCNFTIPLWELGFWRKQTIISNLQGWDKIFALVKPDAVVADFAPYALLAAAGRVPTFAIGNGFFVPALCEDYLTPDDCPPSTADRVRQDVIFANVRDAFRSLRQKTPEPVAAALCSLHPCPATLPELDPRYALRPDSLVPPELDTIPAKPCGSGNLIFLYLGTDAINLPVALQAVEKTGLPAILHFRGVSPHQGPRSSLIRTRATPFSIEEIAHNAGLVIHHGGIGITHLAALAGVPQLIVHRGSERWLNARSVSKTGAGGGRASKSENIDDIARLIIVLLRKKTFRDAALRWAETSLDWIAARRGQDVIADRIMRISAPTSDGAN